MGTLTMALAGVMLAGSAPEKVSGEMDQMLDMRGEWAGTLRSAKRCLNARYAGGILFYGVMKADARFVDWGHGLLWLWWDDQHGTYGSYRHQEDGVRIALKIDGPAGWVVLTLRRVRPRQ